MNNLSKRKNSILAIIFIGTLILLTPSAFISWYYRVATFYSSFWLDFIAEVVVYLIHIIGMLLFSVAIRKRKTFIWNKRTLIYALSLWFLLSFASIATDVGYLVLILGLVTAIVDGFLFGYYLTVLSDLISAGNRGFVFGGAGALSSIGTYLISLPMKGSFLQQPEVWILYFVITLAAGGCGWVLLSCADDTEGESVPNLTENAVDEGKKSIRTYIVICGLTILLLSMVGNIGFYFPSADITEAGINLQFSRAFYSIGLLVAGLIHDRNIKSGLILSSTTILFPFVSLLLEEHLTGSLVVWILAYIILGFVSVSRVLLFVNPAGGNKKCLFLAPIGFVFGRTGEAIGTSLGIFLTPYRLVHISATALVCILSMLSVFFLFDFMTRKEMEWQRWKEGMTYRTEEETPEVSPREQQVLKMLLNGQTNKEIATELFISENTVKYHVKNIYKKTGCNSRKELIQHYYKGKDL